MATQTPPPYRLSNDTVWVLWGGVPHEIDSSQPNFQKLRMAVITALASGDWSDVPNHLSVAEAIVDWAGTGSPETPAEVDPTPRWSPRPEVQAIAPTPAEVTLAQGTLKVVGGIVHRNDKAMPAVLNDRVMRMIARKEDARPILLAWDRVLKNPNPDSGQQLFAFLAANPGIAFTDDGYILFYKGVRQNFRDCHSGVFDNSPGETIEMDRARVSSNRSSSCSFGFHVGSRKYASGFGNGQTVICKVDPADVVCVPLDCSQQKIRVCKYTVVGVDNGGLLTDTNFGGKAEPIVPAKPIDATTGEPPVDLNEPLRVAEPVKQVKHTDGSDVRPGETAPLADDAKAAVILPLSGTEWDDLSDMDSLQLMGLRIMRLRAYARFNCLIIGASKMRGGKAVLVPAIIKARGYADLAELEEDDDG